jgi:outer membrane receptor protein involved in Fe transport
MSGKKLLLLTVQTTPYIYKQPQPGLNFNISKNIGEHFSLEFSADNLLNSKYMAYHDEEESAIYMSYSKGRTFGLSLKYSIE